VGELFSMSAPSMPVQAAPSAPAPTDNAVTQAAERARMQQQLEAGRASTFLTNPQSQRTAQKNQQRTLGGV
jgi:hypothetical protein